MSRAICLMFALLACLTIAVAQEQPAAPEQPEEPAGPANTIRLVLPPDLYAVAGHEMSIYFDNIVLVRDIRPLVFDVECAKGRQDEERWRFVPAAEDVGDHALRIKVTDGDMNLLADAQATLHVVADDAGAGREFSLLCVGDSLTHASIYPAELYTLFSTEGNAKVRFVGTHRPHEGLPPGVTHEGYGGWQWATFCTRWTEDDDERARSKFLRLIDGKPTLDFQFYCDENNDGQGPDFLTVLLGCNDTFSASEETIEERINVMFGYADTLLAEFRKVRPDTQIGILLLVPPAGTQDAFGVNYKCGQTRWQYRRNQHRVIERQLEKFLGREDENIFVLPAHVNLDAVNNYPISMEAANSRNETKVGRLANGVHPAAEGYKQIADTIYAWLKYRLAQ